MLFSLIREGIRPFKKLKCLKVNHLAESDLHQKLIISRIVCKDCVLQFCAKIDQIVLGYIAYKNWLHIQQHTDATKYIISATLQWPACNGMTNQWHMRTKTDASSGCKQRWKGEKRILKIWSARDVANPLGQWDDRRRAACQCLDGSSNRIEASRSVMLMLASGINVTAAAAAAAAAAAGHSHKVPLRQERTKLFTNVRSYARKAANLMISNI